MRRKSIVFLHYRRHGTDNNHGLPLDISFIHAPVNGDQKTSSVKLEIGLNCGSWMEFSEFATEPPPDGAAAAVELVLKPAESLANI